MYLCMYVCMYVCMYDSDGTWYILITVFFCSNLYTVFNRDMDVVHVSLRQSSSMCLLIKTISQWVSKCEMDFCETVECLASDCRNCLCSATQSYTELTGYKEIFAALEMKHKNVIETIFTGVELTCRQLVDVDLQLYRCLVICRPQRDMWQTLNNWHKK